MVVERRKDVRMALTLPVRVQGYDLQGRVWEEMSAVIDVSARGASFPLRHPVRKGQILYLSLPLPKRFRLHDLSEVSYRVYALVRSAVTSETGWRVGAYFLGRTAPRDFEKDPGGTYLLPGDPAPARRASAHEADRRQHNRLPVIVNVRLRRMEPGRPDPQQEQTYAENVSRGGMRVLTSMPVDKGEVLALEELGGTFRTRVAVRGVWIGPDNVPRLNLEFLDGPAPDALVATA